MKPVVKKILFTVIILLIQLSGNTQSQYAKLKVEIQKVENVPDLHYYFNISFFSLSPNR